MSCNIHEKNSVLLLVPRFASVLNRMAKTGKLISHFTGALYNYKTNTSIQ